MEYNKTVTLRDGTLCQLSHATTADAAALVDFLRTVCGETDNLMRYADEVTMTVEEEEKLLTEKEANPRALMLSVFVDGKLVANAGISPVGPVERVSHRTALGISILRDYWGKGIGTLLMSAVIEAAKSAGYTQLELGVVATNDRAIALYEKFGFVRHGTIPNAFVYRNGRATDEHQMYKTL